MKALNSIYCIRKGIKWKRFYKIFREKERGLWYIKSIFFFFALFFAGLMAQAAELRIRTLRPVEASLVYYTLQDSKGKTLYYQKIKGSQAARPVVLLFPPAYQGRFLLRTSFGQFSGRVGGQKIFLQHPYIQWKKGVAILQNRYTIRLQIKTARPSMLPAIQYLFLTNFGITKKIRIPGNQSHVVQEILVQNMLPGYAHLSTSFGQFVVQMGQNGKVYFTFRGYRHERRLVVPIEGGANQLEITGEMTTDEKGFTSRETGGGELDARILTPSIIEAFDPKNNPVILEAELTKGPKETRFYWKGSFGIREGKKVKVLLPLGRHPVQLTISQGVFSKTIQKIIQIIDRRPPKANIQVLPLQVPGKNIYRLEYQVQDEIDPNPRCYLAIPLSKSRLSQIRWKPSSRIRIKWGNLIEVDHPNLPNIKEEARKYSALPFPMRNLVEWEPSLHETTYLVKDKILHILGKEPRMVLLSVDRFGNFSITPFQIQLSIQEGENKAAQKQDLPKDEGLGFWEFLASLFLVGMVFALLFLPRQKETNL